MNPLFFESGLLIILGHDTDGVLLPCREAFIIADDMTGKESELDTYPATDRRSDQPAGIYPNLVLIIVIPIDN